eukprot:scaffold2621_cov124-Isochrysis_galbana.AAC.8
MSRSARGSFVCGGEQPVGRPWVPAGFGPPRHAIDRVRWRAQRASSLAIFSSVLESAAPTNKRLTAHEQWRKDIEIYKIVSELLFRFSSYYELLLG